MTNPEFSNTFDTLLNSYNTQANFGEQASKREIVLDEYEKSVLLTQAQDIIVKSYFDKTLNQQGQGFDDSSRRQVDFSSLIKTATLKAIDFEEGASPAFDDRGVIYKMPMRKYVSEGVHYTAEEIAEAQEGDAAYGKTVEDWKVAPGDLVEQEGTTDVLFILNEKLVQVFSEIGNGEETIVGKKNFVIVPISYKEYDREMSKAYSQPLKKQAWRLFQNQATGFDVNSELIPRFNVVTSQSETQKVSFVYKIRYVKRPRPIVLEDLPDDLEIDGVAKESECELNPIIHIDILNKAVELAIATRGGTPQQQ